MSSHPSMTAFLVLLAAALAAAQSSTPSPAAPSPAPRPCVAAPEHRAFDFWVGEWDVRPADHPERPPSHSRIERIEDGCVIYEQYTTPQGYSGRSFNAYHPEKREWQQFWVDNAGGIHHYRGQAKDGNLYYEAASVALPGEGAPVRLKMTFFNLGKDKVRQFFEKSADGGKTWSKLWDLIYTRR